MLYPHAVVNTASAPAQIRCFAFIPNLLLRTGGKLEATYGSHVPAGIHGHEHVPMHRNAHTCSRDSDSQPHDTLKAAQKRWYRRCGCKLSLKGAFIMRDITRITFVLAVALFVLASRTARADEFDRLMVITFSGSVEVPGAVLPAGTYQFKLADPDGDRNVVEIRSADGSKVYATLLTIPNERATPTDQPVVTFEERPAGCPEAIRA